MQLLRLFVPALHKEITAVLIYAKIIRIASCAGTGSAPGTTFKRHLKIARGVLSEDDTLLREILFNPRTKSHVEQIRSELKDLIQIIDDRDEEALNAYLTRIRKNIK